MRGQRVKNIVRELNNEKVDIIRWYPEPREMVLEALKPAKIKSVTLVPERKTVIVRVDEDQLSLAIGKRGQNARLTAKLTGWEINIEKDESAAQVFDNKVLQATAQLASQLGITADEANLLVKNGMGEIDALLDAEPQEIAEITGLDLEKATAILASARQTHDKNLTPAG
jgi:N utilization substance protein A